MNEDIEDFRTSVPRAGDSPPGMTDEEKRRPLRGLLDDRYDAGTGASSHDS
jgi:hypothetical protein